MISRIEFVYFFFWPIEAWNWFVYMPSMWMGTYSIQLQKFKCKIVYFHSFGVFWMENREMMVDKGKWDRNNLKLK